MWMEISMRHQLCSQIDDDDKMLQTSYPRNILSSGLHAVTWYFKNWFYWMKGLNWTDLDGPSIGHMRNDANDRVKSRALSWGAKGKLPQLGKMASKCLLLLLCSHCNKLTITSDEICSPGRAGVFREPSLLSLMNNCSTMPYFSIV